MTTHCRITREDAYDLGLKHGRVLASDGCWNEDSQKDACYQFSQQHIGWDSIDEAEEASQVMARYTRGLQDGASEGSRWYVVEDAYQQDDEGHGPLAYAISPRPGCSDKAIAWMTDAATPSDALLMSKAPQLLRVVRKFMQLHDTIARGTDALTALALYQQTVGYSFAVLAELREMEKPE